jgi:hypothetical protein
MSIISSASGSVLISSGALNSNYSGSVAYGPKQVSDGLVLYVDAANPLSYSGSGNIWYDLTKNGYNGALSGSAAVVPSWDSTHQGKIHVKASSSYPNFLGPASSSYVNFNILNDSNIFSGINPKFSFNIWFEIDYSKQIIEYSRQLSNWYSFFGGNAVTIFSKFGDANIAPGENNRQFVFQLLSINSNFPPTASFDNNPYTFQFAIQENPTLVGPTRIVNRNTSSLYYIPDKTPINIHINYDGGLIASSRIEFYINGYKTQTGDSIASSGPLTGNHLKSNARLVLGGQIGQNGGILEGITENSGQSSMMQADAYYYLFQVYNKTLSAQEVEQNYYAHKYRFIY